MHPDEVAAALHRGKSHRAGKLIVKSGERLP